MSVLPLNLCSQVVYFQLCPSCSVRYVGLTTHWLSHRICDHEGVSYKTRQPKTNPQHFAIRDHSKRCKVPVTHTDYSVLKNCKNNLDLIISESLFIQRMNPRLTWQLLQCHPTRSRLFS